MSPAGITREESDRISDVSNRAVPSKNVPHCVIFIYLFFPLFSQKNTGTTEDGTINLIGQ